MQERKMQENKVEFEACIARTDRSAKHKKRAFVVLVIALLSALLYAQTASFKRDCRIDAPNALLSAIPLRA